MNIGTNNSEQRSPSRRESVSPISPNKRCIGCTEDHAPKRRKLNSGDKESVQELKHDINQLQTKLGNYKEQYIKLVNKEMVDNATVVELRSECDTLRSECETLKKERKNLENQLGLNQKDMDEDNQIEFFNPIPDNQAQDKQMEENVPEPVLEIQMVLVNEKLRQREEDLNQKEKQLNIEIQKAKEQLEADLEKAKAANGQNQNTIFNLQNEVMQANGKQKELSENIRVLTTKLNLVNQQYLQAQEGQKEELAKTANLFNAQIDQLKLQYAELEKSKAQLEQQLIQKNQIVNRRIVKAPRHPVVKPAGIGFLSTISALGGAYFGGPAIQQTVTFLATQFCNEATCYNTFSPFFLPILGNSPMVAATAFGLGTAYIGYKMIPDANQ